jgi:hypothetical protein
VRRVFLEDPHAAIPSLNPAQNKQFVVSATTTSPEIERENREAFWYREKMLERLRATWTTTKGPKRSGTLELRSLRFGPRMVEAIKVDEVGIDMSIEQPDGPDAPRTAYTDEAFTFKVHVTNRTSRPISPILRIRPALRHRATHVALDLTRKLAWNGTLQRVLPKLQGHESTDFLLGMTALARGQYELTATVEELRVHEVPAGKDRQSQIEGRLRSDSQNAADAAIGPQGRRAWHSRRPFILTVCDRA